MAVTLNANTSTGFIATSDTSGVLQLQTGGTTAVTVDASQNVGANVTPSAWKSNYKAVQVGNAAAVVGRTDFNTNYFSSNWYVNSSNQDIYQNTGFATIYSQGSGTHAWYTAASGTAGNTISFTQAMTLDASGQLTIGATGNFAALLSVKGVIKRLVVVNGTIGSPAEEAGLIYDDGSVNRTGIYFFNKFQSQSDSWMSFKTMSGGTTAERLRIDSTGGLILAGSTAQKATGTTWSNPSDQRLKDNIRDYEKGTTELMQVRVREWEYNGKGGTTEGMKGFGVVADEVMTVLPNTVENYNAKLNADDEEITAIKKFDATEITWLLVKTVQEQQAIITQLQADVAALKGTA